MTIGERIKEVRKSKKISVDYIAKELGVAKTTIYRYEDSTTEKIPVNIFTKLCNILSITPAELMGNQNIKAKQTALPVEFKNARDAMKFIISIPMLTIFDNCNITNMNDETIVNLANKILQQLKLVSCKYK